ncbi:MAG: hypothetical protein HETSPECPRED_004375 [Heterodermia speciosa]|uniref:Uncharacterized protein n=1 Tax=Heterodermia speciosa TaxID=116794 RepID=A0A8H3FA01_9LECA|nr:MAG: hypothetical protein HETSPECPRED_004375 [Heterodermia speciosa]
MAISKLAGDDQDKYKLQRTIAQGHGSGRGTKMTAGGRVPHGMETSTNKKKKGVAQPVQKDVTTPVKKGRGRSPRKPWIESAKLS